MFITKVIILFLSLNRKIQEDTNKIKELNCKVEQLEHAKKALENENKRYMHFRHFQDQNKKKNRKLGTIMKYFWRFYQQLTFTYL